MNILVTGSAGYIGATFAFECLNRGYKVIGIDNYLNSTPKNTEILKANFGDFFFIEHDLSKNVTKKLQDCIKDSKIDFVVHFAALKAVGESELQPMLYWENNLKATMNVVNIMLKNKIKKIVFSSSATVYGDSQIQPIKEDFIIKPTSTYGSTKIASEYLLNDLSKTKKIDVVLLRYFNPVGCHAELKIFEDPNGQPNNLMPRIIRTALGLDKTLKIFGKDYDTADGTGERDYIHIQDLVDGHLSALNYLKKSDGCNAFNLGTGKSVSVLELIKNFEIINNTKVATEFISRREGDVDRCYADPAKSSKILKWNAKKNLREMCEDAWLPFKDRLKKI